jgi:hypothetical protein
LGGVTNEFKKYARYFLKQSVKYAVCFHFNKLFLAISRFSSSVTPNGRLSKPKFSKIKIADSGKFIVRFIE